MKTGSFVASLLILLHAVFLMAPWLAPYDPAEQNRSRAYEPPSTIRLVPQPVVVQSDAAYRVRFFDRGRLFGVDEPARIFLLGTDGFGRDQFSRLLYGGRISLAAGMVATAVSLLLGVLLGATAGYCGGWVDAVLMRTTELFLALPWLYLLLAVRAFLPLDLRPVRAFFLVVLVVGAVGWARPARLIRGLVLSVRERGYVIAARAFGASPLYLLWRHILPETKGIIFTQAALLVPRFILAEVTLSFLGLGLAEPVPSLGNMLAVLQQYSVVVSYWWMLLPGVALVPIFLGYFVLTNRVLEIRNSGRA